MTKALTPVTSADDIAVESRKNRKSVFSPCFVDGAKYRFPFAICYCYCCGMYVASDVAQSLTSAPASIHCMVVFMAIISSSVSTKSILPFSSKTSTSSLVEIVATSVESV